MPVLTPDDIMDGQGPQGGRVMLYDDDHYYMGSVIAEALVARGCAVDFVTPATKVGEWTDNTLEQSTIMRRLMSLGVRVRTCKAPERIGPASVVLGCTWTGGETEIAADGVLMVTSRLPQDALFRALREKPAEWVGAGVSSVRLIGDAAAPGSNAWANYAGRRFAEEIDTVETRGDVPAFRREIAAFDPGPSQLPQVIR